MTSFNVSVAVTVARAYSISALEAFVSVFLKTMCAPSSLQVLSPMTVNIYVRTITCSSNGEILPHPIIS
jgi:hypothetical protein